MNPQIELARPPSRIQFRRLLLRRLESPSRPTPKPFPLRYTVKALLETRPFKDMSPPLKNIQLSLLSRRINRSFSNRLIDLSLILISRLNQLPPTSRFQLPPCRTSLHQSSLQYRRLQPLSRTNPSRPHLPSFNSLTDPSEYLWSTTTIRLVD